MKTNLKKLVSLLLVAVMLVSSFSGFGTLTAHAQHFTLIRPDEYPYLHIDNDMTLQLDLTGRSGAVGAINWQLTDTDNNPIEGTAEYPVYTVSTSAEAAALGASGDVITLHGSVIAAALGLTSDLLDAELGVTPTIPKQGVEVRLYCEEVGNNSFCEDINLVSDWYEVNDFDVGTIELLLGRGTEMTTSFEIWRRNAADPVGAYLPANVTGVTAKAYYDETGAVCAEPTVIAEQIDEGMYVFTAVAPGKATFEVVYEDSEGNTGKSPVNFEAVAEQYELHLWFPDGCQGLLKNDTVTVDTQLVYRRAEKVDGSYFETGETLEEYTLVSAVSQDAAMLTAAINDQQITLASGTTGGNTGLSVVAETVHNGQTVRAPANCGVSVMDHYCLTTFDGLDLDIAPGDSMDLSMHLRNTEYTYVPGGQNTVTDVTDKTDWTISFNPADAWEFQNSAELPVIKRISGDFSEVIIEVSCDCGEYGVMESRHVIGVGEYESGPIGGGDSDDYSIWWSEPENAVLYEGMTAFFPLNTESLEGKENVELEVLGAYPGDEDFVYFEDGIVTPVDGGYTVDGTALVNSLKEACGDDFGQADYALIARVYVDGSLRNEEIVWGMAKVAQVDYSYFPCDMVALKSNGSSHLWVEKNWYCMVADASRPYGEEVQLLINDVRVSNVEGTAEVTVIPEENCWTVQLGSFFEGSFDVTMYFDDPLTGEASSYTFNRTYVEEIWRFDLHTDNHLMLPGESRTVVAEIEHLLYDLENGFVYGDTSAAVLDWQTREWPGVTYTVEGNTLTVDTTLETGIDNTLPIDVVLQADGVTWENECINLRTREAYFTMSLGVDEEPEIGESANFTPTAQYTWLDENNEAQRKELTENDNFCWTINIQGENILSADGVTVEDGQTCPLGTEFRYSRTSLGWSQIAFTLTEDVDGGANYIMETVYDLHPVNYSAWFAQDVYKLNIGDTLNLQDELIFDPANVDGYVGGSFSFDESVISIDEDGVVSALEAGESWVGYWDTDGWCAAECVIQVRDSSHPEVSWGNPEREYLFDDQTLFIPLDASGLAGRDDVALELDCGFWEDAGFVGLGDEALTLQYADEDETQVSGVLIDGGVLYALAMEYLSDEPSRFGMGLIARVYVDGELYQESETWFEMRATVERYMFPEGETLLTEPMPMEFAFETSYDVFVQNSRPAYVDGAELSDRFWFMRAVVLEGDEDGVVFMEPNDDESAYILQVKPEFIGKIQIDQAYTCVFAQGGTSFNSFVLEFVDDMWFTGLQADENRMLPGEQRTIKADVQRILYDPEQGHFDGDTSGAVIEWVYDSGIPGVTFTPNGDTLTVSTDSTTDVYDIPVGMNVRVDGNVIATDSTELYVMGSYFTFGEPNTKLNVALGDSVTFTPVLYYRWLDDETLQINSERVSNENETYVLDVYLYDERMTGLTVDGTAVESEDRFLLGTSFTYTQSNPDSVIFGISAKLPAEDPDGHAMYLCSTDYYVDCSDEIELDVVKSAFSMTVGDTLNLKENLVCAPADLLDYLGNLSWVSTDPAVAEVNETTGVVTAKAPGVVEVALNSDRYDEMFRFVVVVATVQSGVKDPIPEQDITRPADEVGVVDDPVTSEALQDETIGLLGKLADGDVSGCFEGDEGKLEEAVINGASLKTELIHTPLDDAAVGALPPAEQNAMKDKIGSVLGEGASALYFDITLQLSADGVAIGTMVQTDEPLEIRLTIPTELRDAKFRFSAFRLHNGVAEEVETVDNGDWTITIITDRFSTYALGYAEKGVTRLYGQTRFDTSMAVADELKAVKGIEKFDNIIVARGSNLPNQKEAFADALSGSYLAYLRNAPILLADTVGWGDAVNNAAALKAYIEANMAPGGTVYLLGGNISIPENFSTLLTDAGINVKRLGGATRYDTNLAILNEIGVNGEDLLVCSGENFPDSLSASAAKRPILLVENSRGVLTENQKAFLAGTNVSKFYLIGGDLAVCAALEEVILSYGKPVERLKGDTRFHTSVRVAEAFFTAPESAVLAYSHLYPDGLCGGPLAIAMNAPLLLSRPDYDNYLVPAAYLQQNAVHSGIVLGGPNWVKDHTVKESFGVENIVVR